MIDYGLFMMIYKPSKLIYSSVHIDRVYHLHGIIFHEYHYIRISVLTDPYSNAISCFRRRRQQLTNKSNNNLRRVLTKSIILFQKFTITTFSFLSFS